MSIAPGIKLAGVLYTADTAQRRLLWNFADEMKARGWRVGGLVQDPLSAADGSRLGVDAVAMDTGDRLPIARSTAQSRANKECMLDHAALVEASAILRRAVEREYDLVVVEKFGEQEQAGGGLMDDILRCVAAGIPVAVMVPAHAIEKWREYSGGLGVLLPSEPAALGSWWGAEHALDELARNVSEAPAKQVIVGINWTLVEGPDGCGLAQSPAKGAPGCRSLDDAGELVGRSLRQLAAMAKAWNPFEAAIGIAAINAHYNRYDLVGGNENGLDAFTGSTGTIGCIGRFPSLGERYSDVQVIEINPADGEYPETATEQVVASCDGLLVTSSVLINKSFPRIMNAAGEQTETVLIGPGTPLAPALGHYGVGTLSGLVVEDVPALARMVAEGGSVKKMKRHGRQVTMRTL